MLSAMNAMLNAFRTVAWAGCALWVLGSYAIFAAQFGRPNVSAIQQVALGADALVSILVAFTVAFAFHAATWWKPEPPVGPAPRPVAVLRPAERELITSAP